MGAVTPGCLSMLTVVLERPVALVLVTVLPLVGGALLSTVQGASDDNADNGNGAGPSGHRRTRWSALQAMAGQNQNPHDVQTGTCERGSGRGRLIVHGAIKLVPFFCYALVFGSVHFSWLGLQDEVDSQRQPNTLS